jgi:hypothetical protein
LQEWFRAFDEWARLAYWNFREGSRDPETVALEKKAFRAGWRAAIRSKARSMS